MMKKYISHIGLSLSLLFLSTTTSVAFSTVNVQALESKPKVVSTRVTNLNEASGVKEYTIKKYMAADTTYDKLYTAIFNALVNLEDRLNLTELGVTDSSYAFDVYSKVLIDHPEFSFMMNLTIKTVTENNTLYLSFSYSYSDDKILAMQKKLNDTVTSIISAIINPGMTDLQKEFAIHNYLINNCKYDTAALDNGYVVPLSFTAYGALVNGVAVCQGYAEAFSLLLDAVGIENGLVISDTMNHAWNYVNIGGKYYHVDTTWDDPISDKGNLLSFMYFNLSDSAISKDHDWDKTTSPAATDIAYDFLNTGKYEDTKLWNGNIISSVTANGKLTLEALDINTRKSTTLLSTTASEALPYQNSVFYTDKSKNNSIYKLNLETKAISLVYNSPSQLTKIEDDGTLFYTDLNKNAASRLDISRPTSEQITEINDLINKTNSTRAFFYWNTAYDKATKLPEPQKTQYIAKLNTILPAIYTPNLQKVLGNLMTFSKTNLMRSYIDILYNQIPNLISNPTDRNYLTVELSTWGQKMVYSHPFFFEATSAIINVQNLVAAGKITEAKTARATALQIIEMHDIDDNRKWLTEQLPVIP